MFAPPLSLYTSPSPLSNLSPNIPRYGAVYMSSPTGQHSASSSTGKLQPLSSQYTPRTPASNGHSFAYSSPLHPSSVSPSPTARAQPRTDPRVRRGRVNVYEDATSSTARDARRAVRRDNFLGEARGRREEARWSARGDVILHRDLVEERAQWQARKDASVPAGSDDVLDDDDIWGVANPTRYAREDCMHGLQVLSQNGMYTSNPHDHGEGVPNDAEIEAMLQAEQEELDALIRLQEQRALHSSSPIYAEDADFEDALVELTQDYGGGQQDRGGDAMDMS